MRLAASDPVLVKRKSCNKHDDNYDIDNYDYTGRYIHCNYLIKSMARE